MMRIWPVQDAETRFGEILEACLAEGPQLVTRDGSATAVLVSIEQWRRLQAQSRPSLKDVLLADEARVELEVPARGVAKRRPSIVTG
jgi:antitoxin Phd